MLVLCQDPEQGNHEISYGGMIIMVSPIAGNLLQSATMIPKSLSEPPFTTHYAVSSMRLPSLSKQCRADFAALILSVSPTAILLRPATLKMMAVSSARRACT